MSRILLPLLLFTALFFPLTAAASADPSEFERILQLRMVELTAEAQASLEKKYPHEDWERWNFPKYVFVSKAVETAYKIAVKEPELLRRIPCYCFCDALGHRDLLHCFLREGRVEDGYDEHAAGCPICYGQAMLAFLWHQCGATEEEIRRGMEKKFAPR